MAEADKFADMLQKMDVDSSGFMSGLHGVQKDLTKFQVLLVEAYLLWALNNRTHDLAQTLLNQQVSTIASNKNNISVDMFPSALYNKALEKQR